MPTSSELIERLIRAPTADETVAIDFKRDAYSTETRYDLMKDLMSMANALEASTRLIIVGVYAPVNAPREWHPIDPARFEDDANLQQVVHGYIEPVIPFSYRRQYVDGKLYGVLEIEGDLDPPYVVKKEYNGGKRTLKEGECWIRRGTTQSLISRRELDRLYAGRNPFRDKIQAGFSMKMLKRLAVRAIAPYTFPSAERLHELKRMHAGVLPPEAAAEVHEIEHQAGFWAAADAYDYWERRSARLEVFVVNEADRYLEDARVSLYMFPMLGVRVMEPIAIPSRTPATLSNESAKGYPRIRAFEDGMVVADAAGITIEHHRFTPAFEQPLRIGFHADAVDRVFEIRCRVGAKNLPEPVMCTLEIEVQG